MRVEKIGLATLYLGDCRDVDLTPAQSVISDPPYGMAFQSNYREEQHEKIANDETEELLLWACGLSPAHSSYLFCRWDNLATVPKPKSLITWVKDNWSMGDLKHEHGRQTEVALFYPGPEHDFPKKRPPDVINCPRSGNALHPTEKPVGLMSVFVDWTRGMIADPFMGAGSTGIAAVKAKREFIGVELREPYFNIACARIEEAQRQNSLFDTFGGQGV